MKLRLPSAALLGAALAASTPGAAAAQHPGVALTLEAVLDAVAGQHPLVEAARARVEAARGARVTAGLLPNPVLGYTAENLPLHGSGSLPGIDRETSELAVIPLEPLFQRRPRVRQADLALRASEAELVQARRLVALDAARAETSVQRALTLRQVGATVGAKQIGDRNTLVLGLTVPVPLFDRNQGEVRRARAEATAAEAELKWVEARASAQVKAAWEAASLLNAEAARLGHGFLPRAEETRRIALAAYREGAVPLLQVLDATRALADARQTYYRALFAARQSLLELDVAAGRDPATPFGETTGAIR